MNITIIKRFGDIDILFPFGEYYKKVDLYESLARLLDYLIYNHYIANNFNNINEISNLIDLSKPCRLTFNKLDEIDYRLPFVKVTRISNIRVSIVLNEVYVVYNATACLKFIYNVVPNIAVGDIYSIDISRCFDEIKVPK